MKPLKMGDMRLNFRRLSKMVLGGYGGASLLFFGLPYPGQQPPLKNENGGDAKGKAPNRSRDVNMVQEDEAALTQLIHDADDEEIKGGSSTLPRSRDVSFHLRYPTSHTSTSVAPSHASTPAATVSRRGIYPNSPGSRAGGVPFPSLSTTNLNSLPFPVPASAISPSDSPSTAHGEEAVAPPPVPSWWEILTGKKDREIFEGFASAAIAAGEIREGAKEAKKILGKGRCL